MPNSRKGSIILSVAALSVMRMSTESAGQMSHLATVPSLLRSATAILRLA